METFFTFQISVNLVWAHSFFNYKNAETIAQFQIISDSLLLHGSCLFRYFISICSPSLFFIEWVPSSFTFTHTSTHKSISESNKLHIFQHFASSCVCNHTLLCFNNSQWNIILLSQAIGFYSQAGSSDFQFHSKILLIGVFLEFFLQKYIYPRRVNCATWINCAIVLFIL